MTGINETGQASNFFYKISLEKSEMQVYAYQELPHSEDTTSPNSQEEDKEREKEHIY